MSSITITWVGNRSDNGWIFQQRHTLKTWPAYQWMKHQRSLCLSQGFVCLTTNSHQNMMTTWLKKVKKYRSKSKCEREGYLHMSQRNHDAHTGVRRQGEELGARGQGGHGPQGLGHLRHGQGGQQNGGCGCRHCSGCRGLLHQLPSQLLHQHLLQHITGSSDRCCL